MGSSIFFTTRPNTAQYYTIQSKPEKKENSSSALQRFFTTVMSFKKLCGTHYPIPPFLQRGGLNDSVRYEFLNPPPPLWGLRTLTIHKEKMSITVLR